MLSKPTVVVGFIIGAIVTVIARFVIAQVVKTSARRTIEKVKKNPDHAHKIAAELDIPLSRKGTFTEKEFSLLKDYLRQLPAVGNYKILFTFDINPLQLLVFTKISYKEYDGVVSKNDINKNDYFNFLLVHDPHATTLEARSEMYVTSEEKIQKETFLNAVFSGTKV